MTATGPHVQLRVRSARPQPRGVRHVLVAEGLGGPDVEEGRRQTGEVLDPGRRGVAGDVGSTGAVAEVRAPPCSVGGAVPRAHAGHLDRRRGVVPVVEHRVDQQLSRQVRPASVPRKERDRGGEPTTGAHTADDDAARVDPMLGAVLGEPDESGVPVLDGRGVLPLGREPVLDRGDRGPGLRGQLEQPGEVVVGGTRDHPAAVQVVEHGHRTGVRPGPDQDDRRLGRVPGDRHPVGGRRVGAAEGERRRVRGLDPATQLVDVVGSEARDDLVTQCHECCRDLGIEGWSR